MLFVCYNLEYDLLKQDSSGICDADYAHHLLVDLWGLEEETMANLYCDYFIVYFFYTHFRKIGFIRNRCRSGNISVQKRSDFRVSQCRNFSEKLAVIERFVDAVLI